MSTTTGRPLPSAMENHLLGLSYREVPALLPGIALAALVAAGGMWLARFLGATVLGFSRSPISSIMTAMLIGLAIGNLLPLPQAFRPGVRFSVRKILRLGIILLGIRLSVPEVMRIGALGVPAVAICIATALAITTALCRWLRLPERLGTLIAVGTGICGVSAIVATAPAIEADDEEVAYAVANVTLFGALATFLYPYLAHLTLGLNPVRVGLFLGTSVHDTSQVTASALIFDQVYHVLAKPSAADIAVVTKMVRNVFMALVVPLMAYLHARRLAGSTPGKAVSPLKLLPLFVLGFLLLALIRSLGDITLQSSGAAYGLWPSPSWQGVVGGTKELAEASLVLALAAVGLDTRFRLLKGLGLKPFCAGLSSAALVGVMGLACAVAFGPLLTT